MRITIHTTNGSREIESSLLRSQTLDDLIEDIPTSEISLPFSQADLDAILLFHESGTLPSDLYSFAQVYHFLNPPSEFSSKIYSLLSQSITLQQLIQLDNRDLQIEILRRMECPLKVYHSMSTSIEFSPKYKQLFMERTHPLYERLTIEMLTKDLQQCFQIRRLPGYQRLGMIDLGEIILFDRDLYLIWDGQWYPILYSTKNPKVHCYHQNYFIVQDRKDRYLYHRFDCLYTSQRELWIDHQMMLYQNLFNGFQIFDLRSSVSHLRPFKIIFDYTLQEVGIQYLLLQDDEECYLLDKSKGELLALEEHIDIGDDDTVSLLPCPSYQMDFLVVQDDTLKTIKLYDLPSCNLVRQLETGLADVQLVDTIAIFKMICNYKCIHWLTNLTVFEGEPMENRTLVSDGRYSVMVE